MISSRPEPVEGPDGGPSTSSGHDSGLLPPRLESAGYGFEVGTRLPGRLGRTGIISTPHGVIKTPAFIAVGTQATVKAVLHG